VLITVKTYPQPYTSHGEEKFFNDLALKRDLYLFVGSHYVHHVRRLPDPFIIVGVFYPPHLTEEDQLSFDFTL